MEHHQDVPDPTDTGDPSRPQGGFWHPEERHRGANFMAIHLGDSTREAPEEDPEAAVAKPQPAHPGAPPVRRPGSED